MVWLFALAAGIAALDLNALFFLTPFVTKDLHLSNTDIGVLTFAVMMGAAISGLVASALSDRLGRRKPFLIGAFLLFACFSMVTGLARSFSALFAARLLMGLCEGPVVPIQQSIVMAESSPHRRGFNMGVVGNLGTFVVAGLLAPLIIVHIATVAGWRSAFFLAGIPGFLVALLMMRYIREPSAAVVDTDRKSVAERIRCILAHRNVRLCALVTAAWNGWFYLLMTFLPTWFTRHMGFSAGAMSSVMATVGIAGTVSAVIVPWISDKVGRRPIILMFTSFGAVVPVAALLIGPHPIALALCLTFGFMSCGTVPLLVATVPLETVSAHDAATAPALIIAFAQIGGGMAGPLLAGVLADRFGLAAALWLAIALVAVQVFGSALLRETAPIRIAPRAPYDPQLLQAD